MKRPVQYKMNLSVEERERIDRIADYHGLDAAGLLRMLVRREFERIVGSVRYVRARHKKSTAS